jgi:hypothetical protein
VPSTHEGGRHRTFGTYAHRRLNDVKRGFNGIKWGHCIATRSDKTACSRLADITFVAAALIWIQSGFGSTA